LKSGNHSGVRRLSNRVQHHIIAYGDFLVVHDACKQIVDVVEK
jgi:hypothetical protein